VPGHDPVGGAVGRVLRDADAKLRPLFQAFEDEVDPEALLPRHSLTVGSDVVFLLELLRLQGLGVRPFDRNAVVARKRLDPLLVLLRPFGQDVLGERGDAVHVAEEMHDVLRPRQQGEVPLNDDAIETVVYKPEQAAKQLVKGFHRSSPLMRASATRSCARRLVETTFFDRFRPGRSGHPQFHNQGLCP
jgi:hypothetical protein